MSDLERRMSSWRKTVALELAAMNRRIARIEGHPWFNQDSEGACAVTPQVGHRETSPRCSGDDAGPSAPSTPDAKPADAVVVTDAMVERAAVALAHFDIRSVRGATDSWRMIWIKWDEDAKEEVATEEVRDIYRREARAALEAALGGDDEQK